MLEEIKKNATKKILCSDILENLFFLKQEEIVVPEKMSGKFLFFKFWQPKKKQQSKMPYFFWALSDFWQF